MKARDNPFRTDRILRVRYRLQGTTWEELMRRLATLHYRAAIVGPDGSGKTTLLEDLEPRLFSLGFTVKKLQLDASHRAFPSRFLDGLGERDVILFDGADLAGRLAWLRLKRRSSRAAGLIATSHRAGLLPTLIECATTPELLALVVQELLGADATELRGLTRSLFAKHQGNLRAALRELYDLHAGRECRPTLAAGMS